MENNGQTIDYERKFVELLGFHLVETDSPNYWLVFNDCNCSVGYVEFKKLYKGSKKRKRQAIYGYHTVIDTPMISSDNKRSLTDGFGHDESDVAHFSFDVLKGDKEGHADISMGMFPGVTVWSKNYGFMQFDINPSRIFLNYKSRTENFNLEEILVFKNRVTDHCENKEYTYQIRSCKKNYELSDDNPVGRTSREISGVHSYYDEDGVLKVSERTWVYGHLRNRRDSVVTGTVEEMAEKHEMGIDSLNHFRAHIKKVLPIRKDIMSTIVGDDIIQEGNFQVFFPDRVKDKAYNG